MSKKNAKKVPQTRQAKIQKIMDLRKESAPIEVNEVKAETPAGKAVKAFAKIEATQASLEETGQALVLATLAEQLGMDVKDAASFPDRLKEAGLPAKMAPWQLDLAHKLNRNAIDACLWRNNRPLTEKTPELSWAQAKETIEAGEKRPIQTRPAKTQHSQGNSAAAKVVRVKTTIFGFPTTRVMMWMGKNGYGAESVKKVLAHFGIESTAASIATFVRSGIKGDRGEVADLSKAQAAEIKSLVG